MTDTEKTAAQLEAEGATTVDVQWRDITFTVPAVDEIDLDTLAMFESGKVALAIKAVLGTIAYAKLQRDHQAKHGTSIKARDGADLLNEIAIAYGFTSRGE